MALDTCHCTTGTRRGSILVIVAALCVLLLTSFLVITRQLRADTTDGTILMRDAQARIMLPSALGFILESARLGQHNGEESFGWTDVRDGGVGPRGPIRANGSLPPEVSGAAWPALGTHYRADMTPWMRPPKAVRLTRAYNPLSVPTEWLEEYERSGFPESSKLHLMLNPTQGDEEMIGRIPGNPSHKISDWYWTENTDDPIPTDKGLAIHWNRIWLEITKPFDAFEERYHHALQPQPDSDALTDFIAGDRQPRAECAGLGWFRLYREREHDHNGDGSPWFDTAPLSGHGVFIITCGAGQTRGYRDWHEVLADGAGALFLDDPAHFEELRARERILWFRAEWSGFTGGGLDALEHYHVNLDHDQAIHETPRDNNTDKGIFPGFKPASRNQRAIAYTNLHTQRPVEQLPRSHRNSPIPLFNVLGTIRWIERLDREPIDAGGKPIW